MSKVLIQARSLGRKPARDLAHQTEAKDPDRDRMAVAASTRAEALHTDAAGKFFLLTLGRYLPIVVVLMLSK